MILDFASGRKVLSISAPNEEHDELYRMSRLLPLPWNLSTAKDHQEYPARLREPVHNREWGDETGIGRERRPCKMWVARLAIEGGATAYQAQLVEQLGYTGQRKNKQLPDF